jgi:hypothetical protein
MLRSLPATLALGASLCLSPALLAEDATPPGETAPAAAEAENQRPYLGVTLDEGAGGAGVVIQRVYPGSTAAEMNLQPGDRIISIAGKEVTGSGEVRDFISNAQVGQNLDLVIKRGDAELNVQGDLKPLSRRQADTQELQELRRIWRERQMQEGALRQELAVDAASPEERLAVAMKELADALNALPTQLEQTSAVFKTVYPEGTFHFRVEIDIRSNASDPDPMELGPGTFESDKPETPAPNP